MSLDPKSQKLFDKQAADHAKAIDKQSAEHAKAVAKLNADHVKSTKALIKSITAGIKEKLSSTIEDELSGTTDKKPLKVLGKRLGAELQEVVQSFAG